MSYAPGQIAPTSGLYAIVQGCPVCPSEVALMRGQSFPSCHACAGRRYTLKLEAEPIEDDPDFRS